MRSLAQMRLGKQEVATVLTEYDNDNETLRKGTPSTNVGNLALRT